MSRVMNAAVKDRRRRAVELRLAGATYEQIAEQVGYASKSSAHEAVAIALREAVEVPAREMVEQESGRLDALQMAVWSAARKGDMQAVDRVLRIMERRARLHGLDHADGLAERQVQLEEEQGRLIVLSLERILRRCDELVLQRTGRRVLDPMDPEVRDIVRSELQVIAGEAS